MGLLFGAYFLYHNTKIKQHNVVDVCQHVFFWHSLDVVDVVDFDKQGNQYYGCCSRVFVTVLN